MDSFNENVIEFLTNSHTATVTFTQGRYVSKIKSLAEKFPDEVKITHENADGSIVAHIPTEYISISRRKMDLTDEERKIRSERAKGLFGDGSKRVMSIDETD